MKLCISRVTFFLAIHLFLLFGFENFDKTHIPFIICYVIFKNLSITMGMHRLWTHETYQTNKFMKILLAIFCNATFEGSIKDWTSNHRMHHRFEETNPEFDPYSIKKGFLWAHILAHCYTRSDKYNKEQVKICNEFKKSRTEFDNKLIDFEHTYYVAFALFTGLLCPILICKLLYSNSTVLSCFYSVVASIVTTYHATWCINSFAHLIGDKPFVTEHTSGDNHLLGLITCGEGYHNYHHAFPKDYKSAYSLKTFNLSAWCLAFLHKIGIVKDLKVAKNINITKQPDLEKVEYTTIH
jgi:stearoyl-CoA desaturase (Delta-9 desaturase)